MKKKYYKAGLSLPFFGLDFYFLDFFQVWKIARIQDSVQTLSLQWRVAYHMGVHTILNSFLCQHEKQSGKVLI